MPSPVQMRAFVVGLKHCPAPPGGEDHVLGVERLHHAGADVARDAADARPLVVEDHRGREPLLVAVDAVVVLEQLLVEDVEDRLAGDVGDVVRAGRRGAAEGAGAELALVVAVERDPDVLEVQQLVRRGAAHDLDRVLVAEEVRALDGVVGVRLPRVLGVERRVDPAGGRDRVRAHRVDLAHDRHRGALVGGGQGGALAGEARSDDQDVVCWHGGAELYRSPPTGRPVPGARRTGR